ncbi:hypothetical protein BaRGS_00018710 [Batillaria attramentaria]|uniref:Uncharacterized protein n=1 Tax=Batillaria attramentaria TaxID=370345 RepID=A0ABD0KS20_9CAEN
MDIRCTEYKRQTASSVNCRVCDSILRSKRKYPSSLLMLAGLRRSRVAHKCDARGAYTEWINVARGGEGEVHDCSFVFPLALIGFVVLETAGRTPYVAYGSHDLSIKVGP